MSASVKSGASGRYRNETRSKVTRPRSDASAFAAGSSRTAGTRSSSAKTRVIAPAICWRMELTRANRTTCVLAIGATAKKSTKCSGASWPRTTERPPMMTPTSRPPMATNSLSGEMISMARIARIAPRK